MQNRLKNKKVEHCTTTMCTVPISILIGLHAVQFGNNWMKKISRTAKIGRGRRPSPI